MFIFSRVGCDAAVQQCLHAGLRLTTPEERDEILRVRRGGVRRPPGRGPGRARLPRVPRRARAAASRPTTPGCCRRSSSASRSCSRAAWCKVVFATETLALGINMPARTVVIEKLSKWNGETHADITPGEYTQLTGRAGRRGLDVEGHAVVLWQPGIDPAEVAGLASTRTYPLRSSFRPSYNMAVNLVHQVGRAPRARAAGVVLRPVPGRQGGRRAGPAAAPRARRHSRATPRRRPATAATSWRTPPCGSGSRSSRGTPRGPVAPTAGTRWSPPWSGCTAATSSRCPAASSRGTPSCSTPARLADGPRPHVLTADRQARRLSWSTSRRP